MKNLQRLWTGWWRAQWRGTLGVALASAVLLMPRPASADFCGNCIYNQSAFQTGAQLNISSASVRGQLTVGTLVAAALNINSITAVTFIGGGALITNLNASALTSGTVPSARVSGTYSGITGVGTLASGTWQATAVGTQYGGTGANWSGIGAGALPYFSGTGALSTLASPGGVRVLQTAGSGAAPAWTNAPTIVGTNLTAVPLTALLSGTLSTSIGVSDGSLSTVSAAKVSGNIAGGASFLTVPLPIANLAGGAFPTSNPASSVTATGTPTGTFGGPTTLMQARVGWDGRLYDVKQFNLVIPPPIISTGALPSGVTIAAQDVTSGTLRNSVIASSVAASGIAPGTYGGAAKTLTITYLGDGRASAASAQNISLPLAQLNSGALPGGITLSVAQLTAGVWPANVPVSSVAASGVTAGTCGGPGTVCAPTFGIDGRATSFSQFAIPGVSTNSVLNNIDNVWSHSQTSLFNSSWTINGIVNASQVQSANFNGVGTNLNALTPANFNAGYLPGNVIISSINATIPLAYLNKNAVFSSSLTALGITANGFLYSPQSVAPQTAQGEMYLNSSTGQLMVSLDGATFINVATGTITAGWDGGDVLSSATFHDDVSFLGNAIVTGDVTATYFHGNATYLDGLACVSGVGTASALCTPGIGNTANGNYAFAVGRDAHADLEGCFVWGDNGATAACTTPGTVVFQATNGFTIKGVGLAIGAAPVTWYYCSGSTAGTYDGNLARDNSNAGACAGGTWVATLLSSQ